MAFNLFTTFTERLRLVSWRSVFEDTRSLRRFLIRIALVATGLVSKESAIVCHVLAGKVLRMYKTSRDPCLRIIVSLPLLSIYFRPDSIAKSNRKQRPWKEKIFHPDSRKMSWHCEPLPYQTRFDRQAPLQEYSIYPKPRKRLELDPQQNSTVVVQHDKFWTYTESRIPCNWDFLVEFIHKTPGILDESLHNEKC